MELSVKQQRAISLNVPEVNAAPIECSKDEQLSVSEDNSNYSEEENIAKAARLGEPELRDWRAISSPLAPYQPPLLSHHSNTSWTTADSAALYGVNGWSEGYFHVAESGHLTVLPRGCGGPSIDVHELTVRLTTEHGLQTPLILRFPEILGHRIESLHAAFESAIRHHGYPGKYQGVFPIKCNHEKDVISSVVEYGRPLGFGLEVGSKAELILAAAAVAEHSTSEVSAPNQPLLICNGYKDLEYMELAMCIAHLGPRVVIVMEQPEEVSLAIQATALVPNSPVVFGIRAKLSTIHGGHWASTSGDKAKFGLNASQIVAAVHKFSNAGLMNKLVLLHFHVGSQMSSLAEVRDALAEGSALFAELVNLGATDMSYLDVGGGLAIDYDGSGSEEHTSRAYGLSEYAVAVVGAIGEACAARGVRPPTIVSESGRAIGSHHAVIIFDVLDDDDCHDISHGCYHTTTASGSIENTTPTLSLGSPFGRCSIGEGSGASMNDHILHHHHHHHIEAISSSSVHVSFPLPTLHCKTSTPKKSTFLLNSLHSILDNMTCTSTSLKNAEKDANYFKEDALRAFKMGVASLQDRAAIDDVVQDIHKRIHELKNSRTNLALNANKSLSSIENNNSKMVHINLSVFRSAVDCWAISQVFPIMPLAHLDKQPDINVTLADLTCDSDGKINSFVNPEGGLPRTSLPIHSTTMRRSDGNNGIPTHFQCQPYRLGMFLTGVYQETMGSNHNMFGSLNAATVCLSPDRERNHSPPPSLPLSTIDIVVEDPGGLPPVASCMSLCSSVDTTITNPHCSSAIDMTDTNTISKKREGTATNDTSDQYNYEIRRIAPGESVAGVLSRAGHQPDSMLYHLNTLIIQAVESKKLEQDDALATMQCISARMAGYTYMKQKNCY